MSTPEGRRVKIGSDERTGWSSDRPRRDGQEPKPRGPQVAVRSRVLPPTDRQRYSPGSVVVIAGGTEADRERFVARRVEEQGALLSAGRIRRMVEGKVPAEKLEDAVAQLIEATVTKRVASEGSVIVLADDLTPASRQRFVEAAARARRPRHLIFLDLPTGDDEAEALRNDLRRQIDGPGLGEEGFMTVLRLGGRAVDELKRIVFRPPPADD